MTESAAIPQYLATRYGPCPLAVGMEEHDYGLWLDWLHRSEATLTFPLTIVLRYTMLEPEGTGDCSRPRTTTPNGSCRDCGILPGRWAIANGCALDASRWQISASEYVLLFARTLNLDHKFSPEIVAYRDRLFARAGFLAAQIAQGD